MNDNMELSNVISDRIKGLRIEKDVTLEEVAQSTGMTRSLLSKYERAKSEPGLRALRKLSDYYNVTLDYLLGETDEKRPTISHEDLRELFSSLSAGSQKETIRFMKFLQDNPTDKD